MVKAATLQEIQTWPAEDQLELLFRLWDALADDRLHPTLPPEFAAELQARVADYEADPTRVLTWDEVTAHVRRPR